jgi:hypothetical protein
MEPQDLWKSSLELNEILNEVNNDIEGTFKRYQSNIAASESAILAIKNLKHTLSQTAIKSLDEFLNFYLFIITFQLDISVVLHRYLLSKVRYEYIYFGKSSALLIYEYISSIHHVFNKFSKTAPPIFQSDIQQMKIILKELGEVKKSYGQLKIIRNVITAHRHTDAFEYLRTTYEMDSYDYIKLILPILKINTSLSYAVINSLKKIDDVVDKSFKKIKKDNHES